jgi:hypothetical protein
MRPILQIIRPIKKLTTFRGNAHSYGDGATMQAATAVLAVVSDAEPMALGGADRPVPDMN